MSDVYRHGLITLGNSGVGKSFLADILIGSDAFLHRFNATSVTQITNSIDASIGLYQITIFDIPGLIEAEQQRIEFNKREIDKAFAQRPKCIIVFVFSHKNGRIRDEDVVAFNAINEAYSFQSESLILIVNGVPKNRPDDYEETTLSLLQKLLKDVNVNNGNLYFTDLINANDVDERQALRNRLVPIVSKFVPKTHEKKQDIQTTLSELKDREEKVKEKQVILEAERKKHEQYIAEQKRIAAEKDAEARRKREELENQERERQRRIVDQQRQIEIQRKKNEDAARILRDTITNAGMTVPAGQTHYSNVALANNTFHVYGIMKGRITGQGTIRLENGSQLDGGVDGTNIDIFASGSVSIGGDIRCRNLTLG